MVSPRNKAIAARFDARAETYDNHADVQRQVAARLATLLPVRAAPRVLEIGCGTGLFSRHLAEKYPDGNFAFTDLSPRMVEACRRNVKAREAEWRVMDAERPSVSGPFDIIAASMTLHWLAQLELTRMRLRGLLAPSGLLLHATPVSGSFCEWEQALADAGCETGLIEMPDFPDLLRSESFTASGGAMNFLRSLDGIGGTTPRDLYRSLNPGALRRAMRILDRRYGGNVTWKIGYATASALGACRATPSISAA